MTEQEYTDLSHNMKKIATLYKCVVYLSGADKDEKIKHTIDAAQLSMDDLFNRLRDINGNKKRAKNG